jgi:hypothetical protein
MRVVLWKQRWLKITLIVFVSIVAVLGIAVFAFTRYGSPIIQDKVNKALLKGTDSLYRVTFDRAEINLWQGAITISNATLIPDTAVYRRNMKDKPAPAKLYRLHVNKLILNHVHPFKLYFKHQLDIADIILTAPEVEISAYPTPQPIAKPKDNRTLYQRMSQSLKMLHVGHIQFKDVKLKYRDYSTKRPAISEWKELDLNAHDLLIDSATQFDTSRFLYCRELTVALRNYHGQTAKGLYAYKVKEISYSTRTKLLQARGFMLQPLLSPAAFFQKTYGDRFILRAGALVLRNFDFEIFDKNHTIKASCLTMNNGDISVYSNYRTNPKSLYTDKVITFPNKALRMLPIKVKVDTLKVKQYTVNYREYSVKAKQSGYLTFNRINGRFINVSNDSATISHHPYCYAQLQALFLNRAPLNVSFAFNLADSLCSYKYNGWVGALDVRAVNVATVPLASLKMQSGMAKRVSFNITGNRHTANGTVAFLYNDLKIQLLKADSAELKMRRLALASLLVNSLIIKNNNPDKIGETPRSKFVVYDRPKTYPFFETLWRTLLMGIKSCAGLDFQAQRDADLKAAQKQKEKYWKEHKKEFRKMQRKEKRELKKLKKQQEKARKQAEDKNKSH